MQARVQLIGRKDLEDAEKDRRLQKLEGLRDLLISYAGLNMQEPTMFPQPQGCFHLSKLIPRTGLMQV